MAKGAPLPTGVQLFELDPHEDGRGSLTEVFREEWQTGLLPVQWNAVRSEPEALRGVHLNLTHAEYIAVVHGHACLGLRDLRRSTENGGPRSCLVELRDDIPTGVIVPPGVAHGLYFRTPTVHLQARSHYHDERDVLRCRWDDPELRIPWPAGIRPDLSPPDRLAPPLARMRRAFA